MKSKKIVALFLSAAMTFGMFSGCGSPGDASSAKETSGSTASTSSAAGGETSANPTATGSVEFWNDKLGGETEKSILDALSTNVKDASGIEMKIVGYPDVASYQTSLQQSVKDPSSPGMFTWWSGPQLASLVESGIVTDLTQEWEDYYIPAGVSPDIGEAFKVDGKIYAAPYSVLYNVTYYNKAAFEKAGITQEPGTFEAFLEACDKLLAAGITPIGLKNDSWAGFIWFQQLIAAFEPQLYLSICDGSKDYTDPDVVQVMEIWRDMLDKGYFAEPVQATDCTKAFALGETAMMLEPNTMVTSLENEYDMVNGSDFDVFVVPSMKAGKSSVFFEASPICVSEASSGKEDALQLLRGFYDESVQTVMCEKLGIANTSTVTIENETLKKIVDYSADADHFVLMLRFYENTPSDLRDVVLDELSRFIISGADVNDVLTVMQAKADETFNG